MTTTRSAQLILKKLAGAGASVLYTAPAGNRSIVKFLTAFNFGGGATAVQFVVTSATSGDFAVIGATPSLGAQALYSEAVWQVMKAGDVLSCSITAAPVLVMVSGAELPTS